MSCPGGGTWPEGLLHFVLSYCRFEIAACPVKEGGYILKASCIPETMQAPFVVLQCQSNLHLTGINNTGLQVSSLWPCILGRAALHKTHYDVNAFNVLQMLITFEGYFKVWARYGHT